MKILGTLLVLSLAALASPLPARAFPGLIRHGYVNCTSCHVSPTGGGVLNAYGRELSGEVLSFAANEGEGAPLGTITPWFGDNLPDSFSVGGDVRGFAYIKDNPVYTETRLFLMQADFEVAVRAAGFTLDASIGSYDATADSLRHYLHYQFTPEIGLRAGRFPIAYGIYSSEHTLTTRRDLNFDHSSAPYSFEASWLGERGSAYLTAMVAQPTNFFSNEEDEGDFVVSQGSYAEKGFAGRASWYPSDHYEIGLSYLHGENDAWSRDVFGAFGVLGFSPKLYLLTEWDFQQRAFAGQTDSMLGLYNLQKLNYEPVRGLNLYIMQEMARPEIRDGRNQTFRMGVGTTFFPRPHFELDARWYKQQASPTPTSISDFGWLLAHYYL